MENQNIELQTKYETLREEYRILHEQFLLSKTENELYIYLTEVTNKIDALITLYDVENYDVIFLNEYGRKFFGEIQDKKCWEFLHGSELGPCSFCPNERLTDVNGAPNGIYVWETYNQQSSKWFENHTQITYINGKKLKLEISYDITFRKKDEKRILKLLNQQNILFDIASNLNSSIPFADKIENTFKLIAKQLTPSRIYIWEIDKDNVIYNIFEWKSKNNIKSTNIFKGLSLNEYNLSFKELIKTGRIKSSDISKTFHNSLYEKFSDIHTSSVLIVPIFIENQIIALLGIDDIIEKRAWHSLEINLMKTISELISNVYKRKYYQEEILATQERLSIANAAKDKFFSIIAHDLKNPVYNLISLSDFLMQNIDIWKIDKIKEFVKYINDSSKQGFNLLENLLVWSRSQTGKITINPVTFNLNEIIRDNLYLHKNSAISKNIDLFSINCNESFVIADVNMISTVVRNLISNAIKYTSEGGKITISCSIEKADNKQFRRVSVKDTGVGIAKKDIHKLFAIDNNFSTPGTRDEKGTGLGLILCHEFVEKNGGKIWVESEVGKGSNFIFLVPMTDKNEDI
jgi:signal transduction histidine kinase